VAEGLGLATIVKMNAEEWRMLPSLGRRGVYVLESVHIDRDLPMSRLLWSRNIEDACDR
jgi:hypothetical protein